MAKLVIRWEPGLFISLFIYLFIYFPFHSYRPSHVHLFLWDSADAVVLAELGFHENRS